MKQILLLAACAALWTSCADNDTSCEPSIPKDPNAIGVNAIIKGLETSPNSRTTIIESTAAWASGDALGLFCTQSLPAASNAQYTLSGSTWSTTPILYWKDGSTAHKFLAYAPHASGNTNTTAVKVPAINSQTGTLVPAQDLLISNNLNASGVSRPGDGSIGLVFTHALALVELKIQVGAGITASSTLTSFTLAGGASEKLFTTDATSTIDLSTGTITPGATTNTITVTPTTGPALSSTPISVYALVLPIATTSPTVTITVKDGGVTDFPTATVPLGTTTKFDPAKKYSYPVTITRTAITVSNPTITEWQQVDGGSLTPGI